MYFNQLMYLIDISKTNSISTTAKRMFSSQQTISDAVKKLESELECMILERHNKGVSFTEDGLVVLEYAHQIVHSYNGLLQRFQRQGMEEKLEGKLSIGLAPMAASMFLTDLLFNLQNNCPNLIAHIQEMSSKTIFEALVHQEIDFGIAGFAEENLRTYLEEMEKEHKVLFTVKKLYVDGVVWAMARNNQGIDIRSAKKTAYDVQPFDYDMHEYLYISNNTEMHQKMMKEAGTICPMTYQMFKLFYPRKEFICQANTPSQPIGVYLFSCHKEDAPENGIAQSFTDVVVSCINYKGTANSI